MDERLSVTTSKGNPRTSPPVSESSNNDIALNPQLALRPYQSESLEQVEKAYKRGNNRLLVSLPTGTGKTVVFAHLVARNEGRSLIIAHRDELIEQAFDKIRMVLPNADVGIVKAERNQANSKIVIASIQTLARESRLSQLEKDFSTIIIDEAHHATAESYFKVLNSLGCFNKDNPPLTLGVTATPERGDKVGLDNVFQEIVYHRNLIDMISEQYLSDLTWKQINLDINLDEVGTRAGDFIESELIKALTNSDAPKQILLAFQEYASTRKTIIFVPGVELARQTAKLFQQHNISCESIDGKLSSEERKAILSRLKTGETQVVVNCLILTEGFDESSIDCVLFARPTKSKSFYLQMLGRGTRLHPGKTDCLVLDLVGVSKKHDLITLPNLFGLPSYKLKETSLLATYNEQLIIEAKLKALAERDAENEAKADSSIDYEQQTPRKEPRVINFNWLKLSETRYALSVGKGILFLLKQPNTQDKWAVLLNEVDKTKTLMAKDLHLEYAQGVAQDYVRSIRAVALIDSNASWRSQEPTEKQVSLLKKLGIKTSPYINKGEASDLITIFFANQDLSDSSVDKFILEQTQDNSREEKVLPFNQNQTNTTKAQETKTAKYIPDFAKISLAQSVEQLKLYDSFTLNNYTDQWQIDHKANKSQIEVFLSIKTYIETFLDQEIGIIIAGKGAIGKTHLAVGLLRYLTLDYKSDTFFCDCDALLKRANILGYPKALEGMENLIDKSNVILLDNLTLRTGNANHSRFFSHIINYCLITDKKLIITTKHLSYSTSPYENEDNRDPATFLSLGDVLGIKLATRIYEKCAYLEIVSNRVQPPIASNNSPDILPSDNSEEKVNNSKPQAKRSSSDFSSMSSILNGIFENLRKKA